MSSETATSSSSASTSDALALRRALIRWFKSAARDLPWRRTRDPYAILVSEFMLQQTTVQAAIPYFERWMRELPDFHALAAAGEAHVLKLWEGLGYYSRARNLLRLARVVVADHAGRLPPDPTLLRRLPGIGPYTCGAVASFAFDLPEPAIDANVSRVLARLFDHRDRCDTPSGRRRLEHLAHSLLAAEPGGAGQLNAAIMELGALICRPGQPNCLICPARPFCRAKEPATLPARGPRPRVEARSENRAWVVRGGRVLLHQSEGPRWRGLWLLPRCKPQKSEPLHRATYTITRFKVDLAVWRSGAGSLEPAPGERHWIPVAEIEQIPMPAPHRRAARAIIAAAAERAGE